MKPRKNTDYADVLRAELEQLRETCPTEAEIAKLERLCAEFEARYREVCSQPVRDVGHQRRLELEAHQHLSDTKDRLREAKKRREDALARMQKIELQLSATERIAQLQHELEAAERRANELSSETAKTDEALEHARRELERLSRYAQTYAESVAEIVARGEDPPPRPTPMQLDTARQEVEHRRALAAAATVRSSRAHRELESLRHQIGMLQVQAAELEAMQALWPAADALRALKEAARAQGFHKHRLTLPDGLELVIA